TNGKTTTSAMLAAILRAAAYAPLHNRTGSNMMRGLATTLIGQTGAGGDLRLGKRAIGLFEVDEAVLPQAARTVHPRLVVLANLFRDQLDRYGEVDILAAHWAEMVHALAALAT